MRSSQDVMPAAPHNGDRSIRVGTPGHHTGENPTPLRDVRSRTGVLMVAYILADPHVVPIGVVGGTREAGRHWWVRTQLFPRGASTTPDSSTTRVGWRWSPSSPAGATTASSA